MVERACLLPALLVLLHLLLPLLHLRLEVLPNPHLPHRLLLGVLLPLPRDFLVQILDLVLNELFSLNLPVTVAFQGLTLLVVIIRFLVCHTIVVRFTLILEGHALILQAFQAIEVCLAHLLLVPADFILNF